MRTKLTALFIFTIFFSMATSVRAEVVDSSAGGFTSRNTVQINASPKAVFRHLVMDIGRWWNPEHTYTGASENLSIEPRAGGCFCEKLKAEGGIQHMAVIYVDPV